MQIHLVTPLDAKLRRQVAARARAQLPFVPVISAPPTLSPQEIQAKRRSRLDALVEWVSKRPKKLRSGHEVLIEVAARHKLTPGDLRGPWRQKMIAIARHEFCYCARMKTPLSLPQIGKIIRRDHTTVIHGIRAHCARNELALPPGMVFPHGVRKPILDALRPDMRQQGRGG